MQKDVVIEIKRIQEVDGETDCLEYMTTGQLGYDDQGCFYVSYDENEQMTATHTHVTIGRHRVTLSRQGELNSDLVLEKGKRHLCYYDTGFGALMVGISTSELSSSIAENGGELRMRYTVDINSGYASSNEVNIKVKEANPYVADC